jgi:peptide/nickel transport system ATP-binding protein/oligopeptide transport system ATP-binding protein
MNERQKMAPESDTLLRIEDLRVYFRGDGETARAVDGVHYTIRPQETVCLVGESGCGKTVSALATLGLVPQPPGEIASGRILFDGVDLLNLGEDDLQHIRGNRISMVFQEPLSSLNPVFRVGDQICEAIQTHKDMDEARVRTHTVELLRGVGINEPEARFADYPHQLSGGQRQRVMIAMALACAPQLIIADEPTTALDVTVQAQILRLFDRIQQTHATSVLYITHDLGVVSAVADRVYVMYAGIIVEQGDRSHIFKSAAHPYTRALLAALPTRAKRGKRLYSIPGSVPNPAFKPEGCPFHPRCESAVARCSTDLPGMCDYGQGHLARCPVTYSKTQDDDWCT